MPEVREGSAFAAAFKDSIPVFMGYVPLGIVFGFLFVQAGGSWEMAALASLIVYGGASQYMMIPMLVASMPVAAIALATLVINLRHVCLLRDFASHENPAARLEALVHRFCSHGRNLFAFDDSAGRYARGSGGVARVFKPYVVAFGHCDRCRNRRSGPD